MTRAEFWQQAYVTMLTKTGNAEISREVADKAYKAYTDMMGKE